MAANDNDDKPTLILAVEFERQDANQIEEVAKARGVTVPDLLAEAMQTAFWRFGFKAGIRVISGGLDEAGGPSRPTTPTRPTSPKPGPKP